MTGLPSLRSSIAEIGWPALPSASAATMVAVLQQLEQSQWAEPEQLLQHQLRQLQQVLDHARAHVPYYRERWGAAGVRLERPLSLEALRELPLLSREQIQRAGRKLHSERLLKSHGPPHEARTSGSTGRPVRVLSTEVTRFFWRALTLREHLWHERDLRGTLAAIRKPAHPPADYPEGQRFDHWGPATEALAQTGPCVLLDCHADPVDQAEWLQRQDPDYLLTFPSNLKALARHFGSGDSKLSNLREVRTVSEVVTPDVRRACQRGFGVPLVDAYSSQEVGYIALQCPSSGHYHLQSETLLVEVLDDDGEPCHEGQTGRVVLSTLHNFAMPLIRYEIGDFATVAPRCACGRGLPLVEQILGRVRNMVTTPDGKQQWPLLGDGLYDTIGPIRQYQFVQKSTREIQVRLVADRPLEPNEEAELRALLLAKLPCPFELPISYRDEIPRSPGGTYEDFISELSNDPIREQR